MIFHLLKIKIDYGCDLNVFFSFVVTCEAVNNCSGHGRCSEVNTCDCDSGFKGSLDCSLGLFSCSFLFLLRCNSRMSYSEPDRTVVYLLRVLNLISFLRRSEQLFWTWKLLWTKCVCLWKWIQKCRLLTRLIAFLFCFNQRRFFCGYYYPEVTEACFKRRNSASK